MPAHKSPRQPSPSPRRPRANPAATPRQTRAKPAADLRQTPAIAAGHLRQTRGKSAGTPRQAPPKPAAEHGNAPRTLRDDTATIEWLRGMMRDFVRERRWEKYHVPRNLAASVAVEAGELLELFQWLTPSEAEHRAKNDEAFRKAVGEEMCDVMMYCISLANAMELPVAETIAAKMVKNRAKYPPERYQGHYERPLR